MLLQRKTSDDHPCISASRMLVVFCMPILANVVTKKNIRRSSMLPGPCINASRMLVVFCMHILAMFSVPNEDFGRPNQPFRMRFRSTFQRLLAQIRYSHPLKVLRKRKHAITFSQLLAKQKSWYVRRPSNIVVRLSISFFATHSNGEKKSK